jgi:hypothetical protein
MTCTRTDAHTVGECTKPVDPQRAFKLLVDDRFAFGKWNEDLFNEWVAAENAAEAAAASESEKAILWGYG